MQIIILKFQLYCSSIQNYLQDCVKLAIKATFSNSITPNYFYYTCHKLSSTVTQVTKAYKIYVYWTHTIFPVSDSMAIFEWRCLFHCSVHWCVIFGPMFNSSWEGGVFSCAAGFDYRLNELVVAGILTEVAQAAISETPVTPPDADCVVGL